TSFDTGMLSFTRSIQISEGLFYGTDSIDKNARTRILVYDKGVRGQSSEANARKNEGKSNPQVVEAAVIPLGCDGVELEFSVRVLPFSLKPQACDDVGVRRAYIDLARSYKDAGGYNTLALLYAWNVANGRFAWRNIYQVDDAKVHVV